MKTLKVTFGLLLCLFSLSACSSTPGVDTKTYSKQAAKIKLGMTKEEFLAIFPSAEPRGAKMYPKGAVEVLEQKVSQYSFWGSSDPNFRRNEWTGVETRVTWFYFYEGQLVQYGMPNDWPQDPDKIIEIRQR